MRQQQVRQIECSAAAAEFREVMGKDGRMKKVRRKLKPVADGTPLAKKVSFHIDHPVVSASES